MKLYILPFCFQIIGILVIVAEVFIPSLGLLTAIALGVFAYSLYLVFTTISSTAGIILTGFDVMLVPFVVIGGMKILAKSPLALKKELSKQTGVVSQGKLDESYMDREGEVITDLRPAGMALIDSQRVDVVTDGEYIEAGTRIVVTRVTGNQIVVEAIE
jgi:membrane-bound ClpP family serine protease